MKPDDLQRLLERVAAAATILDTSIECLRKALDDALAAKKQVSAIVGDMIDPTPAPPSDPRLISTCQVCNSDTIHPLGSGDGGVIFYRCEKCGHIWRRLPSVRPNTGYSQPYQFDPRVFEQLRRQWKAEARDSSASPSYWSVPKVTAIDPDP